MMRLRPYDDVVRLAIIALVVIAGVATVRAERIPLADGKTIDCSVTGYDSKGILVSTRDGIRRLPWEQVSSAYPRHPGHRPAPDTPRPEAAAPSLALPGGDFTLILGAAFVVFWVHILSVWFVTRRHVLIGGQAQNWGLAAFVFGLPAVLVFHLRHGRRGGAAAPAATGSPARPGPGDEPPGPRPPPRPVCQFFTWDNQPIEARRKGKVGTGLESAQQILARAVQINASDVHFNSGDEGMKVELRVDGVLRSPEVLDADTGKRTVAAIKMAAGMDLVKLHDAQDGACHFSVNGRMYDLRVARAWAVNGETMVVRLLKAGGMGTELTDLGLLQPMAVVLREAAKESTGIIMMAGPTGSGKTSTIYALLRRLQGTGRNLLTIEDPVEYRLEQATQISLKTKMGETFAAALKAAMRHDPDVILVGEIRDAETMQVAFQAALTGHLVFTTIHASSVLATFARLREMGLNPYLINNGLRAIVCQRLVRVLCPSCRETYIPTPDELAFWSISAAEAHGRCFYRAVGCRLCEESGYHGRQGVFRVLVMDNDVRDVIQSETSIGNQQAVVEKAAVGSVLDYVRHLLWPGITSPDELRRTLDMFDFGKRLMGDTAPADARAAAAATIPVTDGERAP